MTEHVNCGQVSLTSAGERLAAWLYRPAAVTPAPAVLLVRGYGTARLLSNARRAEQLARAGFAALDFDPRGLGDSGGVAGRVSVPAMREDVRAALAWLRDQPGIDAGRVAVMGLSLGGGIALELAADDPSIAAAVAMVPQVDGMTNTPDRPTGQRLRLLATVVADRLGRTFGRPDRLLPLTGRPGSRALLSEPDIWPDVLAIVGEDARWEAERMAHVEGLGSWRNEVAAWEVLGVARYRPFTRVADISCPVLFQLAERDRTTPVKPQLGAARNVARAEVRQYPGGHLHLFHGEQFERTLADQVAFLRQVL